MIIALTGHREEDCLSEQNVRQRVRKTLLEMEYGPFKPTIITGMANGFDLWGGTEALRYGCPVWAAKPWAGHGPRKSDVELYAEVLDGAEQIINVNEAEDYPGPWAYHKRNEWMVDNADKVLAYHNGKQSGGTYACMNYARKVDKKIRNIYG